MNACSNGPPAGVAWVPGELSHPAGPVVSSASGAVPSALTLSSGGTRAAIAGTDSCRAVTSARGAVDAACGWRTRADSGSSGPFSGQSHGPGGAGRQ